MYCRWEAREEPGRSWLLSRGTRDASSAGRGENRNRRVAELGNAVPDAVRLGLTGGRGQHDIEVLHLVPTRPCLGEGLVGPAGAQRIRWLIDAHSPLHGAALEERVYVGIRFCGRGGRTAGEGAREREGYTRATDHQPIASDDAWLLALPTLVLEFAGP